MAKLHQTRVFVCLNRSVAQICSVQPHFTASAAGCWAPIVPFGTGSTVGCGAASNSGSGQRVESHSACGRGRGRCFSARAACCCQCWHTARWPAPRSCLDTSGRTTTSPTAHRRLWTSTSEHGSVPIAVPPVLPAAALLHVHVRVCMRWPGHRICRPCPRSRLRLQCRPCCPLPRCCTCTCACARGGRGAASTGRARDRDYARAARVRPNRLRILQPHQCTCAAAPPAPPASGHHAGRPGWRAETRPSTTPRWRSFS